MAEGAPLLREYRVNSSIEGSNPSFSAKNVKGPVGALLRFWERAVWTNPLVRQKAQLFAPSAEGAKPAVTEQA